MTWTHEKPTKPGWYWWRGKPTDRHPRMLELQFRGLALCIASADIPVGIWGGIEYPKQQWQGPLDPPAAEEGEDE